VCPIHKSKIDRNKKCFMTEKIKIKDEEFSEIKLLQKKFQESVFKFGNLQIEKMELDRRVSEFLETEKRYKEEWLNLQSMEKTLLDKIVNTYGVGNLNMENGTFEPTSH